MFCRQCGTILGPKCSALASDHDQRIIEAGSPLPSMCACERCYAGTLSAPQRALLAMGWKTAKYALEDVPPKGTCNTHLSKRAHVPETHYSYSAHNHHFVMSSEATAKMPDASLVKQLVTM